MGDTVLCTQCPSADAQDAAAPDLSGPENQRSSSGARGAPHKIYPYLLKDLAITRPNHALRAATWCTDTTCIPMQRGFVYLVAIMDWATRRVLIWRLSNTMEAGFCVDACRRQRWTRRSGGTASRKSSIRIRAANSRATNSQAGCAMRRSGYLLTARAAGSTTASSSGYGDP